MAHAVAEAGAHIVVAELVAERGEAVVADLAAAGHSARFVPVDIADEESVSALAAAVLADGPIWGLVNNAGLADSVGGKYFWELSVAEWDRIQAVNARGPWMVSKAFAPAMRASGQGRVTTLIALHRVEGFADLAHPGHGS
jgi:NAD(P)-dependent dehydrogenase (short-subunit alcohol dehydrogenase family)